MPTINIGFTAGGLRLQAGRGVYSVESAPQSFSKTGALGYTITVTPSNPSIASGVEQFTATANYTDGTHQDVTTTATWASSNTVVATISNSAGTQGLATSLSSGFSIISATLGTVTGSTTLSVGGLQIKFNPGYYLMSDVRDYHGGFDPSQRQAEINILATTGTSGDWTGSKFLGYFSMYSWGNLETSQGVYDFSPITNDFAYLQSKCPGARMAIGLWYSASNAGWAISDTPPIPSYILTNSAYGAGPTGGSQPYGYGFSGWNGTSGSGARWQLVSAAVWRSAVQNRFNALIAALANATIPDGSGHTFNTHPLIEVIFDPNENSWNFFSGPVAPADYSSSAQNTQIESEMSAAVAALTQTAFATFQSFGNNTTFPDPNLPSIVGYAAANRNALSNADVFGEGMTGGAGTFGISAQEEYVGHSYNYGTSTWQATGGTDYRGTMAYMAVMQAPDYQSFTGPSSGVAQTISNIYATCQQLHATHMFWNIWDDQTGTPASFVSTYLVPFINTHAIPNTTYPTNYPVGTSPFFQDPYSSYNSFIASTSFAGTNGTSTTVSWNGNNLTAPTYSTVQAAINAAAASGGGANNRVCLLAGQSWNVNSTSYSIPNLTATTSTNRFVIQGDPSAIAANMPTITGGGTSTAVNGTTGFWLGYSYDTGQSHANNHVTIRKLRFTNFVNTNGASAVDGETQGGGTFNDLVIEFCQADAFQTSGAKGESGLFTNGARGDTQTAEIRYNKCFNITTIGGGGINENHAWVGLYGGAVLIHHNEFSVGYNAIRLKGSNNTQPNGCAVYNNYIHDVYFGVSTEAGGGALGVNGIQVYLNLFGWQNTNNTLIGVGQAYGGTFGSSTSAPSGLQWYRNTISPEWGATGTGSFMIEDLEEQNATFHSNVLLGWGFQVGAFGFQYAPSTTTIDYNCYNQLQWFLDTGSSGAANITTWAGWQGAKTANPGSPLTANPDSHGVYIPNLTAPYNTLSGNFPNRGTVGTTQYQLASGSPLIGAGQGGVNMGYDWNDCGPGW